MSDNHATETTYHPAEDWTLAQLLDLLPVLCGVVGGGERMKGASDQELKAWAWGIEDTQNSVREIIRAWRKAHG